MTKRTVAFLIAASFAVVSAYAQAPSDPMSGGIKTIYNMNKTNVIKAAEKMPEENYSFKPTPDVRSFGELVGHIAGAQYLFCSAVAGEKPAPPTNATAKADLVAALKAGFDYCDKVYDGMTDAHAAETIKFFGRDWAKIVVLSFNVAHNNEHYGNVVTYMRLKGLVPPSSEKK